MLSKKEYIQAYKSVYFDSNISIEREVNSNKNKKLKSFFSLIIFLSFPLLFFLSFELVFIKDINQNEKLISKNSDFFIKDFDLEVPQNYISQPKVSSPELEKEDSLNIVKNVKIIPKPKLKRTHDDYVTTQLVSLQFPSNISKKKKDFINIILPLSIDQNKKILGERQRLIDIKDFLNINKTLSNSDQKYIKNLALKYSVDIKHKHKIDLIDELLLSVDIIPNSIVIAQAAIESGWGSSRFAKEYNALFGEYTDNNKIGILPLDREYKDKHFVKFFSSIDKSVESYFKNINSHYAYIDFRKSRQHLRNNNNISEINLLIKSLKRYAEDNNYVENLNSIILDNQLTYFDNIPTI